MVDNIKFERVHQDNRGALCRVKFHNRNFELIEVVKNALRGGHFHNVDVTLVTMYGTILYREIIPNICDSEKEIILKTGDVQRIPAGAAHLLIALEDSFAIEFHDQEFTVINYEPYRKLVEDYIRKG